MSYDPRKCGAACDICPLRTNVPVPPESNPGASICVVGEAPGAEEVKEGRPFVGASGQELQRSLGSARLFRRDLHITNAILCQPPKNELDALLSRISAENREREKRNKVAKKTWEAQVKHQPWLQEPTYETLIPTPIECCAPRLKQEVARFRDFITLGSVASKAIMGTSMSILSLRGGMAELDASNGYPARRVMPTVHPAFVLRAPRWSRVFRQDLHRAARWFRGGLAWKPPIITHQPSPEQLDAFLSQEGVPYWTYDLETDGIEPLTARIRCIGIGTPDGRVYLVGLLSKDGVTRFYSERDELRVITRLKQFFTDKTRLKLGHNSGSYDSNCLHAQWGIWPAPQMDTILLHRLVESELPHSLGFIGSLYTDAPSWKCYDAETEVLTPAGWVRFPDLQKGVPVAQWAEGVVSFVQPVAYVDQAYAGRMWCIKSNAADLQVTPDHKMVYKWRSSPRLYECPVQDLSKNASIPHTGTLHGEADAVDFDFVRLLVAFQADGSWVGTETGKRRLDFGFTKQRKIERLTGILDRLGMTYQVKQTGTINPRTRIWVEPQPLVDVLWRLLGPKKLFDAWLLSWSLEARIVFLDELLLWDGTNGAAHAHYFSGSETNADWAQACAAVSGRPARKYNYPPSRGALAPLYRITLPGTRAHGRGSGSERGWSRLETAKIEEVDYAGRIYCVSVPSGFILVRRNGKVTVSGNTDREGNKLAFGAESDEQLHIYCGTDVQVTAQVVAPLFDAVRTRGQAHLVGPDHQIQRICAEMHRTGMWVNQDKRQVFEVKYIKEAGKRLDDLKKSAPTADFNPGSPHQIRRILFDQWGLVSPLDEKERYTASGDPATSDDVLRSLLSLPTLTPQQRDFVLKLRRYRKAQKLLGTYIVKLRPQTMQAELGWDDDEDFEEAEMRKKYGIERTGIVNPQTGRMHPGYNAHVATCVTPDTWVLGEKGLFQVASLVPLYGPPQTEVPAINLALHDGNTFHPVSHLQNPGICLTKTARLSLGITLTGTPHHRIRVAATPKFSWQDSAGKWHLSEPESVWRRLDALSAADYVLVPFGMDVWAKKAASLPAFTVPTQRTNAHLIQPPAIATEDLAYFVGVYNADGSLHDANGSFAIRLSDTRGRYTEALLPILRRLFGDLPVRSTPGEGVAITGIALADWAEAIGLRRKITNKSIPPWLLACPRSYVEAYLRGLSRDAFVGVNGGTTVYWRYTGTEQLCREVQMLLLNMGIVGGLKDARTARSPNTWCLFVTGQEDIGPLSAILGFQIPATEEGDTSQRRPKYIRRGNHLWLRVLSVADGGEQQVYDVTIPETHQFWANGTVSHNTGRLSSSKPINAQNFPKGLRAMVQPAPGRVYIGADADQLELRIAAALWGAERYLRAFDAMADPHSSTALACFSERFKKAEGFPGGRWDGDLFIPDGTGKWTGEAKTYRDLAKRVQYACVGKGTRLVTTSSEGSIPIEDVKDGTPLWAWSVERERYELTRAVGDARKTGTRRVLRVRLAWGQGNRYTSVMILTPDHLCMLRDGTWRAAGNLQPGDRLMPFYRHRARGHNGAMYRQIMPFNDARKVGEHRVIQGFYEPGEGDTHVHHIDEDTFNNNPENLEPMNHVAHYELHKESIDAGRRESPIWRAAVSNAETRRAATQKSWDSGTRKAPEFDSKLDAFREHIGVKTDREVAEMAGCTPENVGIYRKKHGIGKPPGQRGGIQEQILLMREKLGVLTDTEVAALVGCDRANVARLRESLGIPSAPRKPRVGTSKLHAFLDRLGHETNVAIATEVGCTPENVALFRKAHGIPAYWRECPGGINHIVVSVEELAEEQEVWDVEVDHPDHNFALEAGVFVHNSQYMATVETVHRVICQTETVNEDGTSSLPYLHLSLREVRDMHQAWLDGCPEFPRGWDREIREWQRQSYLLDPVGGRRRDFLDGENPNELVNFKIQGAAASLMNKAMIALAERVPVERWGPGTGLVNQCHDAMVLEVPADGATCREGVWDVPPNSIPARVMQDLNECMNQVHPALPGVRITATADIGASWKDVG